MRKQYKLRNVRPKAFLGDAISAASTMAAATMQALATKDAAEKQAQAIEQSAKSNADALKLQNQNANRLQEKSIAFTREQNDERNEILNRIALQSQMDAANQNMVSMKDAARTKVKKGGSVENNKYFLRGRNGNLPFTVIDGGGAIPIYTTPEGYDLYELVGNDHEHYHKTEEGKYTGVGIRFAGKKTIEGEGNQNTNLGELMLVTPYDAKFISKQDFNVEGETFNPAKAVLSGVHPIDAHKIQEGIKDYYGISDNGNNSPVKDMKYKSNRKLRKLRNGGRCKAANGTWWDNYGGATINTGANLLGAGITNLGNYFAGNYLTNAYNRAAGILGDAYDRMHGIDMSSIKRSDYSAAHALAALQAPIIDTGSERSYAERSLARNLTRINRNTLSSAAAQNKSVRAESDYNDMIRQIESNANKYRQDIIQNNMNRITEVANQNANRDTQANQQYANAYLTLLQYNNDIENEKISGRAQAEADALTQTAGTRASLAQANAASWAGALTGSASGFNNTLSAMAKQKNELEMAKLGATPDSLYNYYLSHPNDPGLDAFASKYQGKGGKYTNWYDNLMRAKNNQ